MRAVAAALSILAACSGAPSHAVPPNNSGEPTPPVAARRAHAVSSPNGTRDDPYYWIRDDTRKDRDVLAYLADGNEKRLLAAAKDAGQRTEARAYVGANLLARGERSRAVEILTKVLREDEAGYLEYDLAYYELERLGAATAADRRTPGR